MSKKEEKEVYKFKVVDGEPFEVDRREVDPTVYIMEQTYKVPLAWDLVGVAFSVSFGVDTEGE